MTRGQSSHIRRPSSFEQIADLESLGDGSEIKLRRYKSGEILVKTDVKVTEEATGGNALAEELKDLLRRLTEST